MDRIQEVKASPLLNYALALVTQYYYYTGLAVFSFHRLGTNNALFTGDMEKNDTEQQEEVSFVSSFCIPPNTCMSQY